MKKKLAILLVGTMIASSILAGCGSKKSEPTKKETSGELKGDITFWHSFTQGPRMEVIQQTADQFMKDNPGVKIKIETFSWGDFYTKWTTGLASGNVPDMSTALPGHVVEMMDADALEPVDDLIDDIGRNKFSKTALSEGKKDGTCYSLPLYSHAQVMWYRKDLLQKAGLSVPKTWDEFAEAAKTLTKDMMKRRAKVDYARWVFVLPALLVVGILLIYPIFSSLYYSMTTKHLIRLTYDFIGLENYKAVLADPNFFKAFLNSVLWTLGSLAGQLIIGFTGALAINRVNFGKGIYRTLMIIPWAFPSIVIALSWKWILNGVSGFIPNILVQLGICNELPQFLSDNSFVFLTLIFINIWFGAPMIMVNVLSALQTIPQDQYEAAQIDGASKVQQFWYITVPHIKVVVGLLVVLRTIWVFNNFDIIYLLTGGGPANATTTMPIYAYNMGWNTKLLGRSSAVTMLLLAFLLLVCVIYFTIIGKWEKEDK